jgi:hypothetical protein
LFLPIIAYTLSTTKLEIRAKQFLLGRERVGRERERVRRKGGGWGKQRETTQTLYAHMNKRNKKF